MTQVKRNSLGMFRFPSVFFVIKDSIADGATLICQDHLSVYNHKKLIGICMFVQVVLCLEAFGLTPPQKEHDIINPWTSSNGLIPRITDHGEILPEVKLLKQAMRIGNNNE
jgi:hypothetical protein